MSGRKWKQVRGGRNIRVPPSAFLGFGFSFGIGAGGEELFAFADELGAFLLREGEEGFGALGELVVDEGVGAAELVFNLAGAECVPTFHGDPMGLGQVGRGDDAFLFEQLVEALGAAMEPEDAGTGAVEIGHGEHFAADVAVAGPVDEVMAPVDGLRDVGEGHADGADALVVHGESLAPR